MKEETIMALINELEDSECRELLLSLSYLSPVRAALLRMVAEKQ